MITKNNVVSGVTELVKWWIEQRRNKLLDQLNETMSVNPFLMPFLFDYHNLNSFDDLADLMVASHLMTGHNTGFGKLVDEKILPVVFGAQKLDSKFRRNNFPYGKSCFDEIDHIVTRATGVQELLSLKAGKWTIQLTMAVQLNASFNEILTHYGDSFETIVVGVFYGNKDDLTDKYDILRGVNRGANHNVIDLTDRVKVYAGKEFWSWLNDNEQDTQEWVLEGITTALDEKEIRKEASKLLNNFKEMVAAKYDNNIRNNGEISWLKLLNKING